MYDCSGKGLVSTDKELYAVVEALRGNTFGILSDDGSTEEKIVRLLNLLPMAFEVVDEARDTIRRLRSELEKHDTRALL